MTRNDTEKCESPPRLSVIVPAYNEELRIGATMEAIGQYLARREYDWEAVLVDDGSADQTVETAREAWPGGKLRVLSQEVNRGKGAAIRRAMIEARGQWRLFTDADSSTPIEEVEQFWPHVEQGFDICIGSRALPGSKLEIHQPFYRELMGRCFNLCVRAISLSRFHDTQCGFKMFSAQAAQAVFPRAKLDGWAFDVECLMIARGLGFSISEVPIRWINSPATRVRALVDSAQMFRDILRLRGMYGRDGAKVGRE